MPVEHKRMNCNQQKLT